MDKIVTTGYGVKAPTSGDSEQFLKSLKEGTHGLELSSEFFNNNNTTIIGRVTEGIEEFETNREFKRYSRTTILGIAAAKEAISQANLSIESDLYVNRVGFFLGTSIGDEPDGDFRAGIQHSNEKELHKVPLTFLHHANFHSITSAIAHFIGVKGIVRTISTGCTAGLEAMEEAMLYLKNGLIDVAVVCGVDAPLCNATVYAFAKMRQLPLNQSLEEGAAPFSRQSKGFSIAEGAGVVILERETDALKRKATILGEIDSIISNNDGVNIYSSDPSGRQMIEALKHSVKGRIPDYINSQALGLQTNDSIERICSLELFGHEVPFTSIKGMIGHTFGASGVLQVITSLLSINYGFIPPTIRTDKSGYEDMNIVMETVYRDINEVAITNHGLGGNNACAYIKKY
ncbi:beta-ketoacyl-[acyl-carrier-protein] synthase family protein [Priestia abyssalis]|uniref:beta-ketoacyl-[acyl-carrier-protein] synthase family protein n=1 Tax=Priestia abyssalis TaxID=1221450 RepID=UPI000995A5D8|nr:beta-ketoacyl synthase N-terminal-like domain-containing protein [Priestia abyssalis]